MPERTGPPHALPRRRLAIAAAVLFAMVVVLGFRVHDGNRPLHVDRQATRVVDSPQVAQALSAADVSETGSKSAFQKAVDLGSPYLVLAVAVVLGLLALRRRDPVALGICVLGPILAIGLTELVGKPLVDRHMRTTLAFPSGHATDAGVIAALVLLLLFRWGGFGPFVMGTPVAAAVPLLVSVAVVGLGRHYATDAVAGVAVGVGSVLAVAAVLRERAGVGRTAPALV
jgi:membrane-associated phospholipid phosphatase